MNEHEKIYPYRAVIFDMDGTVLNTIEDLTNSTNYALKKFGLPTHTLDEVRFFVGNGVKKLIERATPLGIEPDTEEFDEIFQTFRDHYEKHCMDNTAPYSGIIPAIDRIKAAGLKVAVVSNKIDSAVKKLNDIYFEGRMDAAIGEREGIARKPAPDMVRLALAELGTEAKDAVYVGDSDVDISTASNSGMDIISVTWGFRSREFLLEHGAKPDRIVEKTDELLEILGLSSGTPEELTENHKL